MSAKQRRSSTTPDSPTPLATKLSRVETLRREGPANLWERVSLLVEIADDPDYHAKLLQAHPEWDVMPLDSIVDVFDCKYLDDYACLGFGFVQLKHILERFPDRTDWQHKTLVEMQQEAASPEADSDGPSKERICWKQRALDAEKEVERLRVENAELRKLVSAVPVA